MNKRNWIIETEKYIKQYFEKDSSGHDWWHIYRVRKIALVISEKEGGDKFIIEMAALLHDLDDWKISDDESLAKTVKWLYSLNVPEHYIQQIVDIIKQVSYKGLGVETPANNIEAKIVQDADRLDALGAIGIARTFAYGGSKGRLIYDPDIPPIMHNNFESYKNNSAPTINHFYEKLLHLKNRMQTKTGKNMAEDRHKYLENYLHQFYSEWDAKK